VTDHVSTLNIEPLSRHPHRDSFDCGKVDLNDYLKKYARQNNDNNISRAFVAIGDDPQVFGYYCISTANIEFEELPGEVSEGLPKYPVPAALIGKLACDQSTRGQGLGARLLIDALQRIVTTSEEMGIKVILVDAIDDEAMRFYQHYGFIPLPGHKMKLFLPIETAAQLFMATV